MEKIGLIFDSSCGKTKKEIESKGFGFIPLKITIDDKSYDAGININSNEVFEKMKNRSIKIKTSLPTGDSIISAFDKVLKNFERAIFIGISHKFSGTINAVKNIASDEKYKGKILIYDSLYSSPWIEAYMNDFEYLVKKYNDENEIFQILDKAMPYQIGLLSPGDIWWFYKGGRINKLQYIAGSLMKMNPILTVKDGEIKKDEIPKIRTKNKTIEKMCGMILEVVNEIKKKKYNFHFITLNSTVNEYPEKVIETVKRNFLVSKNKIFRFNLSSEQSAHMGPGSFGLAIFISLKEFEKGK